MAILRLYRDRKLRDLNMVINTDAVETARVIAEAYGADMNDPLWGLHITFISGRKEVISGLIQQKANGALEAILSASNGGKDAKREFSVESASGSRKTGQRDESASRIARKAATEKRAAQLRVMEWAKDGGYGKPPEGWNTGDPVPEELTTENVIKAKKAKSKTREPA